MYLERMVLENLGPLEKIDINFKFLENGNPKPLILVGENGSGKSFAISPIIDSFYEFANQSYSDISEKSVDGAHYYYKTLTQNSIQIGKEFYYSYLKFKESEEKKFKYIEKVGNLSKENLEKKINENLSEFTWDEKRYKGTTKDKKFFKDEFYDNSYCFFPPFRYEIPFWLNGNAIGNEKFKLRNLDVRKLDKPILISNILENNKSWFLDIIMDSRADIFKDLNGGYKLDCNLSDKDYLRKARENIENIISEIVGKKVKLQINYRNDFNGRFSLVDDKEKKIANSLEGLSTGQLAIFNIFSTIVKYSDLANLHKGIKLEEIKGIVIIEEIDMHQHPKVLNEILPNLIKLFPKVQFIITTHSPLFLLGMEKKFGEDGVSIVELPTGDEINSERFSEFSNSFDYYKETKKFEEELKDVLNEQLKEHEKPLIITEGKTDYLHYEAALQHFKSKGKFTSLDINFLKHENFKEMGESQLENLLKSIGRIPKNQKIIGIFDCDSAIGKKNDNKEHGNGVFSLNIKTPVHRSGHNDICVELLYKDIDLLKKDESGRRLYLSNEFTDKGRLREDSDISYEIPKKYKK